MSSVLLGAAAALGLCAAAAAGLTRARWRVTVTALITIGASVCALASAATVLHSGRDVSFHSSTLIPISGVSFVLDPFGALFTAVTAVVAACAALFWIGYGGRGLSSRSGAALVPLFVTALLLVPAAASVTTFLILWELMAITSLLLVLVDHTRNPAAIEAATWYGVMTQAGAAAILAGLVLLSSHAGSQSFAAIHDHAAHLSPTLRGVALLLVLVGFASKAGAVPFHVWLPRAHPEAPGPVSALMSAGMVNLGIYGIVRVADGLLGGAPMWWWLVVLSLGVGSALFGALSAATSSDLKRLLAYSTTDNMGLALLGVGASGLFAATGHRALSQVALAAALLQVLNHGAFKGCLFLSAGSVQSATGSRDLDSLGGLLRRLPVTGTIFVVGALAISALPPLNGFVSEWLLLQALAHGLPAAVTWVAIAMPIGVATLALTGGLTAAALVKAVGVGLLGRPRTAAAAEAIEVSHYMQAGAGILALACVVLGVVPLMVLPSVLAAVGVVAGPARHGLFVSGWHIGLVGAHSALAPAGLAGCLVVAIALVAGTRRLVQGRRTAVRPAEAWGCGRAAQTARMQYTARSFAEPLERVFHDVLRPDLDLDVTTVAESRYYVKEITYRAAVDDTVEAHLYRPAIAAVTRWGSLARRLPNGSIHRYLAFGFVSLVLILALVR